MTAGPLWVPSGGPQLHTIRTAGGRRGHVIATCGLEIAVGTIRQLGRLPPKCRRCLDLANATRTTRKAR